MTHHGSGPALAPARELGHRLAAHLSAGLPPAVLHEAARCLLNATGAGIAGCDTASARRLAAGLVAAHGHGEHVVVGGSHRLPVEPAVLFTAFCVTQDDFDDAHAATIVHPGAAALAGVLAAAPAARLTGPELLTVFALAVEVQLSVAVAMSPSHYAMGWHSTATCAAFGSATAVGLAIGLDGEQLATALDLAALRVVGIRQAHGTVLKGFQVGRGAAHGVQAALAVRDGATAPVGGVLGRHDGIRAVLTDEADAVPRLPAVSTGPWHLGDLTYKPYPAGIVCSGGLEMAIELASSLEGKTIREIRLSVPPLVAELAGEVDPPDEMRARVSLPHGIAAALLTGAAGLAAFSQESVDDPQVQALRRLVTVVADDSLPPHSTRLDVTTATGTLSRQVDRPRGGADRPLSDGEVSDKASALADRPQGRGADLVGGVWGLVQAPDATRFLAAATTGVAS